MKQKWRDEDHCSDDDIAQDQCGDIDDDDHDNKMAEKGDVAGVDPMRLQAEIEEEEKPEMQSDSEDDQEAEENQKLDDAGKETKRILEGKPKKDKDSEDGKDSEDEQPPANEGENGDTRKKESKKKPEKIILKIPNPSGAAKPASSLGKRSTAEAGAGAGAGAAAAKKVKTEVKTQVKTEVKTEGDDLQR